MDYNTRSPRRPEQPPLTTRIDRLTPLPENVLSLAMSRRAWNGVRVDIAEFHCAGRVAHHLSYRENQPCPIGYMPRHMHFAPAGMEV